MPRLNYPLNVYIKAVEKLLVSKGFDRVEVFNKRGSEVHFDLFMKNESIPTSFWQVHTEHTGRRRITSTEDYKKAARKLTSTLEEFVEVLKQC